MKKFVCERLGPVRCCNMKNLRLRRQRREKTEDFLDNRSDPGDKDVRERVTIHEECTLKELKLEGETDTVNRLPTFEMGGFLTGDDRVFDAGLVLAEYCRRHLEPYMEWLEGVKDDDLVTTDVCDIDLKSLSADESVDSGVSVSPFENVSINAPEEEGSENLGANHGEEDDKDMDDEPIIVNTRRRPKRNVIESDSSESDVEFLDERSDSAKADEEEQSSIGHQSDQESQGLESKAAEDTASSVFTPGVRRSKRRMSRVVTKSHDSDHCSEEGSSDDVQILNVKVFSEVSEGEKPKKRAVPLTKPPSQTPAVARKRSLRNVKKSPSSRQEDDAEVDEDEVEIVSVNLYGRSRRATRKRSTSQDEIKMKISSDVSDAKAGSVSRAKRKRVSRSRYSLRSRSTKSQV